MDSILLDADGIVSLLDKNHTNHEKASKAHRFHLSNSASWFISRYVIAEVAINISLHSTRRQAIKFLRHIRNAKDTQIVETTPQLENLTYHIFKKQKSKKVSYVDCHNIAIIENMELDGIFSFDKHYLQNDISLATTITT